MKQYYDNDVAESIRGTRRIVLKVHGTINTPNQMIFTRDDYAKARCRHSSFYAILEALAITHTFVFLGCGLSDPDIQLLLENYAFKHEYSKPHYFVLPSNALHNSVTPAIQRSLNVKVLTYPLVRGSHDQLRVGIEELRDLTRAERSIIATREDW